MAKKKEKPTKYCRDCRHATDYHCNNYQGVPFLCKCKYHQWSKFLNYSYCEHFEDK